MPSLVEQYESVWGTNPREILHDYAYQPELTAKLDALSGGDLTQEHFYEIVLWKLNRFPRLAGGLLYELRTIAALKPREHKRADRQLKALLQSPGIALPMASTVLRFLAPEVFQIIDDRVYRIVFPGRAKYPSKPSTPSNVYLEASVNIYFDYLDELHRQACDVLPFREADRILYQLDIKLGNEIGD
jgi:hypothetical protein